jgi:hypothetical protein
MNLMKTSPPAKMTSPSTPEPGSAGITETSPEPLTLSRVAADGGLLVPEVGIEPTWGCPRGILSPVRLPVPPLRHR